MGTHPIFESDFDCLTDKMICLMGLYIIFLPVLWIYQNYLRSYLEPVLAPILGPILKPIYAVLEPYIGKYVPNGDSKSGCPVTGMGSKDATSPGNNSDSDSDTQTPKATKRKVKKAD